MTTAADAVARWRDSGEYLEVGGGRVFTVDVGPRATDGPPVLVLHGYPTCSFDWRHTVSILAERRRVVLCDYLGFGLSDKPDMRYGIHGFADTVERVAAAKDLHDVVLVTHDLGDSVGGELLARDLDGTLKFTVSSRVITNGSIYLDLAQLSPGQLLLLSLDDARVDLAALGVDPRDGFKGGVAATCAPDRRPDDDELEAQWLLASHANGHTLLARTIRYIEDRRVEEGRYTGAIEKHPSPLTIVWGEVDLIAVHAMAARLVHARPDASLTTLDGVGHYPMIEDPAHFTDVVSAAVFADEGSR
ncbi:MAG: alpha/beta fold hydrolase [Actinomycetota bacterium]